MNDKAQTRPPVVVVMGHVDHGKSALLDYIRKTNVVETEAGGITQHISAYEVEKEHEGQKKKITFIDTPGHEAFGAMRARGAKVADIAVLVVSAEEGVKKQTLEALQAITDAGIPFIVAINKIDLPNANLQRAQSSLIENEIYIEGMGGDIPWVATSAKTGEGIDELLDTILLLAEMEELTANKDEPASGVVIEANKDPKKGISATLIIKNGSLKTGEFIVAGDAMTPIRIMLDHTGKPLKEATFSSPIFVVGFDKLPPSGELFTTFKTKKEAQEAKEEIEKVRRQNEKRLPSDFDPEKMLPLIVKADTKGTLEAVLYEIDKLKNDRFSPIVTYSGVGPVSEGDVKMSISTGALILAFNVKEDKLATDLARTRDLQIHHFNIIYELADWLEKEIKSRTPKMIVEKEIGKGKLLKIFSEHKDTYIIGGKVEEGEIQKEGKIKIIRRSEEVGEAEILNLQSGKQPTEKLEAGSEFGAQIKTEDLIAEGDTLIFIAEFEE